MLELSSVTLCGLDTANPELALRALRYSTAGIRFARTLFLTDRARDVPGIEVRVVAPLESRAAYSAFVLKTLVEHIRVARHIGHPIDRIIILEHRDCGAYKEFFKLDWREVTPPVEETCHKKQVSLLIKDLKKEFAKEPPTLQFDSFLLARDEDDALHIEIPHP